MTSPVAHLPHVAILPWDASVWSWPVCQGTPGALACTNIWCVHTTGPTFRGPEDELDRLQRQKGQPPGGSGTEAAVTSGSGLHDWTGAAFSPATAADGMVPGGAVPGNAQEAADQPVAAGECKCFPCTAFLHIFYEHHYSQHCSVLQGL